jgi:hypothetical protein
MPILRHRLSRVPFVAGVQMTSIDTGDQIAAHTENLNILGCFVETATPFIEGTNVALRISHDRTIVVAQGKVAYSRRDVGMGIRFTSIESSSESILDAWLTELWVR